MPNPSRTVPDGLPDPARLRIPSARHAVLLKQLLRSLRAHARQTGDRELSSQLKSKMLIREAGLVDTTELHLARLGTSDKRTLSGDDHQRLVDHLWMNGFLDGSRDILASVRASPDRLSHALASWLSIGKPAIADLGRVAAGAYRYWRPAGGDAAHLSTGLLMIRHDAVRQTVIARVIGTTADCDTEGATRILHGYLLGDRSRFFGLLADPADDAVAFLSMQGRFEHGSGPSLVGIASGIAEGAPFTSPIYAESTTEPIDQARRRLGRIPAGSAPGHVREQIRHLARRLGLRP